MRLSGMIERAVGPFPLPPLWALVALLAILAVLFVLLLWAGYERLGRAGQQSMLGRDADLPLTALRGYALAVLDTGRLPEAAAAARAHLAQMPTDVRMRAVLAAANAAQGDLAGAVAEYERALRTAQQVWPTRAAHLVPFMACLYASQATALRGLGRAAEADATLRQALALDPSLQQQPAERYPRLLVEHVRDDELERRAFEDLAAWEEGAAAPVPFGLPNGAAAAGFYCGALTANPNSARLHGDLAQALHALGDHRAAEREIQHALQLDGRDPWLLFQYSLMLWRREDLPGAERSLAAAGRLGAQHAGIRGTLGVLYLRLRRYDEAEAELLAAVNARPDIWALASLYGSVALRQGHLAQAAQAFQQADQLGANDVRFRITFAELREQQGALEAANEQYRIALRHDPGDGDLQAAYGAFLLRQSRLYEAEQVLREALLLPDSETAHFPLVQLLLLERRLDGVPEHLEAALRIDLESVPTRASQAEWLLLTGRVAEAEDLTLKLVRDGKNSPWLQLIRGEALLALGRELEAQAALREAARLDPALPDRLLVQARALHAIGRSGAALEALGRAQTLRPAWPDALAERERILQEDASARSMPGRRSSGPLTGRRSSGPLTR